MKVTAKQLLTKDACKDQVDIFRKEWPKGVVVTEEVLQRAVELNLDLRWFALTFLPAPAWEAYNKAIATALAAFDKAIATALAAYYKATATALWQVITEYKL